MVTQISSPSAKISALRGQIQSHGVDGYLLPLADEFQGEFLPDCAQRLKFLTGFTGSGGAVVVMLDRACAFTDGRYMLQIAQQVDRNLYEVCDYTQVTIGEWLQENAQGKTIGFDPKLFAPDQLSRIDEKAPDVTLLPVDENLIDVIWNDLPAPPQDKAIIFPDEIAGLTSQEKRGLVAKSLKEKGADAALITMPDSVCWLLNVRGHDVEQTPLVRSYALSHSDASADWFVAPDKVTDDVRSHLGNQVAVKSFEEIPEVLGSLKGKTVLVDERHASLWFKKTLEDVGAIIINERDPTIWPKACKTQAEIKSIKEVHVKDGVALAKFLHWVDQEAPKGELTELDIVDKIYACRAEEPAFESVSFGTISGFGANGAIIHYRADEKSNATIKPSGLLLVDSGGQYKYGTTDITRTIAVGDPTEEMKQNFTLVLKGHIDLARARFDRSTTGIELDQLARGPLQECSLDFAHGTGHGVGCYLGVHEEAANISPRGKESPLPGMLISNEPGYYKEGEYGIRIENLILCVEEGDGLAFETVSLAPIDRHLIVPEMLSEGQKQWLNDYHAYVYETLSPLLPEDIAMWLREQTQEI